MSVLHVLDDALYLVPFTPKESPSRSFIFHLHSTSGPSVTPGTQVCVPPDLAGLVKGLPRAEHQRGPRQHPFLGVPCPWGPTGLWSRLPDRPIPLQPAVGRPCKREPGPLPFLNAGGVSNGAPLALSSAVIYTDLRSR